jgi:hypothetical protein
MSRTITLMLLTGFVLLLGACAQDAAFDVAGLDPANAIASRGQPDRAVPFQGGGTGTITRQVYAPGFPTERSTFDGRCSVPSDYVVEFAAGGQLAHLGEVTTVFEHCSRMNVDMATGAVTFDYGDGQMTVVAANGDELYGTYADGSGELMADGNVAWRDTFTLTGGTGRFEGASGSGRDTGTTHSVTGWTVWGMEGTVAYDAAR